MSFSELYPTFELDLLKLSPLWKGDGELAMFLVALIVSLFLYLFNLAVALPGWELRARTDIASLVPGADIITGLGVKRSADELPKYLIATSAPGVAAHIVLTYHPGPPHFFIGRNDQLYQITNSTHMLAVDLLNETRPDAWKATRDHRLPLKLVLEPKSKGVEGTWYWRGTMLHFESPFGRNQGLFYQCEDGVYMPLELMPTPSTCEVLTLHSFISR